MYTIYILALQHGCYYVGRSTQPRDRVLDHFGNNGSAWTRRHRPLHIEETHETANAFDEDKYVKMYMARYGIDHVRGGSYSTIELAESVRAVLVRELRGCQDRCFRCGQVGHFIETCGAAVHPAIRRDAPRCTRCGRSGHQHNQCYATTDFRGRVFARDDSDDDDDNDSDDDDDDNDFDENE